MVRQQVNGVRRDSRSGAVPAVRIDFAPTRATATATAAF